MQRRFRPDLVGDVGAGAAIAPEVALAAVNRFAADFEVATLAVAVAQAGPVDEIPKRQMFFEQFAVLASALRLVRMSKLMIEIPGERG